MATPRRSARLANGTNSGSGNGSPLQTTTNGHHPVLSEEDSIKDQLKSSAVNVIKPRSFWATYEVPRKLLHSSIGVVTLILNAIDPPTLTPLILSLSAGLVIVTGADVIRFKSPVFAKTYEAYLGPLMRDSERHKWNGVIWYLVGVIFVLTLYPRDVAVLSILILSWADTAASTIGRLLSKSKYNPRLPARVCFGLIPLSPNKSLAGFVAAWMTGLIVAVGYYGGGPGGGGSRGGQVDWRVLEWRRGVAFTGSFVGCVAAYVEALDLPAGLDDNLTLPIVSGALVWAFLSFTSRFL
ncbi:Predicted ER membrane protein [Phaffia rhodozyma]|uniref:Predicted ER membrane protein n=1 Tax=Phaffia rhodozyma TaxID=264483 RepID=A0A0F7SWA0_PHARH|nr:Predicted ER membrane protein [Phaffia rhodozyma]